MKSICSITSDSAPKAVGPYSQAVVVGDFVFCSGQIGIDPRTGELCEGITQQTHQVLSNLSAVLDAANRSLQQVIRVEVFVTDIAYYAEVNEIYASYFTGSVKPARQLVEVTGLPKNALIEISCIAYGK